MSEGTPVLKAFEEARMRKIGSLDLSDIVENGVCKICALDGSDHLLNRNNLRDVLDHVKEKHSDLIDPDIE